MLIYISVLQDVLIKRALRLAVAITRLNDRYDANVTYQQGYMAAIAGRIPVERNEATGRLEVDEAAIPAIGKAFGLTKKSPPAAKAEPGRQTPRQAEAGQVRSEPACTIARCPLRF